MRISVFHPTSFVVVLPLTTVLLFTPTARAQTAAC